MKTIYVSKATGQTLSSDELPDTIKRQIERDPESELDATFPYSIRTVCSVCGAPVRTEQHGTSQYAHCAGQPSHTFLQSFDGSVGWIRRS